MSPDLASQIAAGEVVERPASVVKELVENSLDAAAERIDVGIVQGGLELIEVIDDGHGLGAEEARLALERHATSKLYEFTDLDELASYGFRGEALPSIASISRFALRTRRKDDEGGIELQVESGLPPRQGPLGVPVGTHVLVRDLFFNVPARRKFLRSSGTEAGHVADVVLGAALARPDVAFTLRRDGRVVRSYQRASSRAERVAQTFDGENFTRVEGERGPLRVEAFLASPERARPGTGALEILLNGRPIRDRGIAATLAHAYGARLEKGRYPRGVVYLEIAARLVDVNVHPQKSEVRFADPRAVSDAVYGIVEKNLPDRFERTSVHVRAPSFEIDEPKAGDVPFAETTSSSYDSSTTPSRGASFIFRDGRSFGPAAPTASETTSATRSAHVPSPSRGASRPSGPPNEARAKFRFRAQIGSRALLCEDPRGYFLLDQERVSARVLLARLERAFEARALETRPLLFPVPLEIDPADRVRFEKAEAQQALVGLDARVRSGSTVTLHGIPHLLDRAEATLVFDHFLAALRDPSVSGDDAALAHRFFRALAEDESIAWGEPIEEETAEQLVLEWLAIATQPLEKDRAVLEFKSWNDLGRPAGRS